MLGTWGNIYALCVCQCQQDTTGGLSGLSCNRNKERSEQSVSFDLVYSTKIHTGIA